jgi:hypothetical protein
MWQAWRMVLGVDRASLAEAACLLRDGWSPGEETVDLVHGDVTTDQPRTCKTWTKRELAVGDE